MFGSPQNVWPLNELYIRSGANAGQLMDFSGANDLCLDFVNNRYAKALVPIPNPIASAHSTDILTLNAAGAYDTILPNGIPRNNLGSQGVPGSRANDFLNSDAPVTQTVTVVDVTVYTISVVGTGQVVLSGAGSGTVTAGLPITLTTAGTALTCTVSGSLTYAQVEKGSYATPPIITAGAAVTRPSQQSIISGLTLNTGIEFCHLIDIKDPGSDFVRVIQFDDGTNGNRVNVAYNAGAMMLDVYSGGAQQASLNLGPWAEGLQAITGSVGAGFAQGHIAGGAVIAPAAPVLFPVVNQMVDSGTGFDVLDNAYTRSNETYVKTDVLPNAASAAKMEALGAARLAIMLAARFPYDLKWLLADAGGTSTPVITKAVGTACTWLAYENGVLTATYTANNSPTHVFAAGSNNYWVMRLPDNDPMNVTQIDISNDILAGDFPLGIRYYTSLTYLYLYNTGVTGDIANVSALTSLTVLHLYNTGVTGDIANVSALTSLTVLHLGNIGVTGDIANVSALTSLRVLYLYNTGVTGDIANVSALTSLTVLHLGNIGVTGDIANVSALTSLTYLYLYNTGVTLSAASMSPVIQKEYIYNVAALQAAVDAFIDQMWLDRNTFTYATPLLDISGTNANPSGVYQYVAVVTTPLEKVFRLVNPSAPDGDTHNPWTITY